MSYLSINFKNYINKTKGKPIVVKKWVFTRIENTYFSIEKTNINISNVTDAYVGEYTVNISYQGCNLSSKTTLQTSNCDNLYIKVTDPITGLATNKLKRLSSSNGVYSYGDLQLQVQTFDGKVLPSLVYTWQAPNGVSYTPNSNDLSQIKVNKIGNYKVQASSAGNAESCYLDVDIFAEVCSVVPDQFNCGGSSGASSPTDVVNLPNLAAGDKFTTADYTVTVTTATGNQSTGWSGTGSLDFNFLKLPGGSRAISIPIAVSFTNIKINECYQLAAGVVLTQYDADWANVVDATIVEDQLKDLYAEMSDILMADDALNKAALQSKVDLLSEVRNQINTSDFTTEYKTAQLTAIDGIIADCNTLIANTISKAKINESFVLAEAVTRASVNTKIVGACDIGEICQYGGDVFTESGVYDKSYSGATFPRIIIKNSKNKYIPISQYNFYDNTKREALSKIFLYYWQQLGYNASELYNNNFSFQYGDGSGGNKYNFPENIGNFSLSGVLTTIYKYKIIFGVLFNSSNGEATSDIFHSYIYDLKSTLIHERQHLFEFSDDDTENGRGIHLKVYYNQLQSSNYTLCTGNFQLLQIKNITDLVNNKKNSLLFKNNWISKFKNIGYEIPMTDK